MQLAISKKLFLTLLTVGLIAGAEGTAEAYPQLPQGNGPEYLAQFPSFPDRSDFDDDDLEDIREEIEDRREDRRDDRRDDIEDDLEDCLDDNDRRECLEDVREDYDDRSGRRSGRYRDEDDFDDFREEVEDRLEDRDDRSGPRFRQSEGRVFPGAGRSGSNRRFPFGR
ncbi:MAG: hypothetical protein AAFV72_10555 [Cyanobacteria bacterium J06635_1]